ncbi:MAG: ADP-ribosylglycohydrolase family protein [Candidatus Eisenbacteria bacterium]
MLTAERYRGAMLGLATGDALGMPIEGYPPGRFEPLTEMIGDLPPGLSVGHWTDDTSMALCLAESLIEKGCFDPVDQLERYKRWIETGYMSSTGEAFGMGITVMAALGRFRETHEPFPGPTEPDTAGNGSIMRLAPVPLFFSANPLEAIEMAGESSRTTNGATTAVDACRYMAAIMIGALQGKAKDEILGAGFTPEPGYWDREPLVAEISEIAEGSFKEKQPPEIVGTGYVVKSLEAALWAFYTTNSFKDGCLAAVNLGDDADTTGAVYGQIAGAFYGVQAIPENWLDQLVQRELIQSMADSLLIASDL